METFRVCTPYWCFQTRYAVLYAVALSVGGYSSWGALWKPFVPSCGRITRTNRILNSFFCFLSFLDLFDHFRFTVRVAAGQCVDF